MVIQIVLGLIPFVGPISSAILTPVFTGGLLMGIRAAAAGEPLRFDTLFEGFKQNFAPLAGLGALTLAVSAVVMVVFAGLAYVMSPSDLSTQPSNAVIGITMIVVAILGFAMAMLFIFATPLVALNNVPVFQSLSLSFKASLRNILPIIVYGLVIGLLAVVGMIPLLLGLLVVIPLFYVSSYVSYRQVFLS